MSLESSKLRIEIKNTKPIILTDLTISLLNFANQYDLFLKRRSFFNDCQKTALVIEEIKKGSIIVDLATIAPYMLAFSENINFLLEFSKFLKATYDFFEGKSKEAPIKYSLEDCNQLGNVMAPIVNDEGSVFCTQVFVGGDIVYNHFYSSNQAKSIQGGIEKYKAELKTTVNNHHQKVTLYWNQAKFGKARGNSDKAIIESICPNPIKVIFDNDAIKNEMTITNPRFHGKEWQDLAYVVDVEVGTIQEKPKTYKILRCYSEDTFDPSSE